MKKYCEEEGAGPHSINKEAMQFLEDYSWPGNVRELENVIQQMVAVSTDEVFSKQTLPEFLKNKFSYAKTHSETIEIGEGVDLEKILEEIEKSYLLEALEMTDGAKKKAAELLNLSFRSLRYRLKKHLLSDQ